MYCSQCDVLMGDSHKYCYACGAKRPEEADDKALDLVKERSLYENVKDYVIESGRTTKTALCNRFYIEQSYAGELLEILESEGIVGKISSKGVRDVLVG